MVTRHRGDVFEGQTPAQGRLDLVVDLTVGVDRGGDDRVVIHRAHAEQTCDRIPCGLTLELVVHRPIERHYAIAHDEPKGPGPQELKKTLGIGPQPGQPGPRWLQAGPVRAVAGAGVSLAAISGRGLDPLALRLAFLRRHYREPVELTSVEFALLEALMRVAGQVVTRETLAQNVLGRRFMPYDRSIDVQIGRLRRKIEPDPRFPRYLQTVRGTGYALKPE